MRQKKETRLEVQDGKGVMLGGGLKVEEPKMRRGQVKVKQTELSTRVCRMNDIEMGLE